MTTKVMLVEDHELLAESLATALRMDGLDVVVPHGLDQETILTCADRERPNIVLLDFRLDDDTVALPLIPPLRRLGAGVVMVTGETDRGRLAECVEAGALGIVSKAEPFEHLLAAVHEAAELRSILTQSQRDELLAELRRQRRDDAERLAPFDRLTRRERAVLAELMRGKSAETIAGEEYVSLATVRSQIRSVLQKLGVNSQLAAVARARDARWSPAAD